MGLVIILNGKIIQEGIHNDKLQGLSELRQTEPG